MKIVTWNVNSIRARQERVVAWIEKHQPDVLCLQELKAQEKDFPALIFAGLGYRFAACFQKTYNGVAILARQPLADIHLGLDDGADDDQARLVAASVDGVRVISVYVPNGQAVGSAQFAYKLAWMTRLRRYLDRRHRPDEPLVLCGDFNVAPEERDVYDPGSWAQQTLFHLDVRRALEEVRDFGLADAFRLHHQEAGVYSWWDYRLLAFNRNRGLRIDHVLVTPPMAARCTACSVDRDERKGQGASDHAPVSAVFS